jgi:subtilisin family serine protease
MATIAPKKLGSPAFRSFLDLVNLTEIMSITTGSSDVRIGLIDGAVDVRHRGFGASPPIVELQSGSNSLQFNVAHGTFVAGILISQLDLDVPGICPGCQVLVRPVLRDNLPVTCSDVTCAMIELVDQDVQIINISMAVFEASTAERRMLKETLDYAQSRRTLVIAAAGNDGRVVTSPLISHPWVLSVSSCKVDGRLCNNSNTGISVGRRGLTAPGENIMSLAPGGGTAIGRGTSAAAPFVTGAAALLRSCFPKASSEKLRQALLWAGGTPRRGVVPPLLDALSAYRALSNLEFA